MEGRLPVRIGGAALRAVHADLRAADPSGPFGEQEFHQIRDLFGCTETAEGEVALDEPLDALGVPFA